MLNKAFQILVIAQQLERDYKAAIADDGKINYEEALDMMLGAMLELFKLIAPQIPAEALEDLAKRASTVRERVQTSRAIAASTLDRVGAAVDEAAIAID